MGFNIYRYRTLENLKEIYDIPERLILSGPSGAIASYVKSVYESTKEDEWTLGEMELAALAMPGQDISSAAIIIDTGLAQEGTVTLYRLASIRGKSGLDSTEMIFHFKGLLINHPVTDAKAFRESFEVDASQPRKDIYENMQLSGGTRGGSWKWMEVEQILNAASVGPNTAK